jgi:hypothetical protein
MRSGDGKSHLLSFMTPVTVGESCHLAPSSSLKHPVRMGERGIHKRKEGQLLNKVKEGKQFEWTEFQVHVFPLLIHVVRSRFLSSWSCCILLDTKSYSKS